MFKRVLLIVFNYNLCAPFEVTLIFSPPENLQRAGVVGIVLVNRYLKQTLIHHRARVLKIINITISMSFSLKTPPCSFAQNPCHPHHNHIDALQKYKWHRLLAYDPNNDCAGIFMDWFLYPSCCVCRHISFPLSFYHILILLLSLILFFFSGVPRTLF